MKAVILAAGKGTRMRELTEALPKPMLKVQGKPILEHIVEGLISCGIREIFIVTGYRAEVIESHFGDGSRWGARVCYGRQVVQDGTGRAPEIARDFVGNDSFLLTYGDILVRPDTYARMVAKWKKGLYQALATVIAGEDVTKGGILIFDANFRVKVLVEKPSVAELEQLRNEGLLRSGDPVWYNAGIYLFQPSVYDHIARLQKSPRGEYELTDALRAMIAAGDHLTGLEIEGRWVDVRDPEVLAELEKES